MKDLNIISNLLQAGFSNPLPLVTRSQEDLSTLLGAWVTSHPGEVPPAAYRTTPMKPNYLMEITFATTPETVWTEFFRINEMYIGRMLKDADGSCMLVRPALGNTGNRRGYHAWLGGDLGFTTKVIAGTSTCMVTRLVESESEDNFISCNSEQLLSKGQQREQEEVVERETTTTNAVKTEPSRSEIRQRTLRSQRTQHQAEVQRWRFDSPPSSSRRPAGKPNWPPQYVSPPPTPSPKRSRLRLRSPKRSVAMISPSHNARTRSSSLEIISENPMRPAQGTRRSIRNVGRSKNLNMAAYYQHLFRKKPQQDVLPLPDHPRSARADTSATHAIIFHFFLADENLGAIPVSLDQITSSAQFFKQAELAWKLMDGGTSTRISGVSISITGLKWPLVVPWKDANSYKQIMEAIENAKAPDKGDVTVKVKCIAY